MSTNDEVVEAVLAQAGGSCDPSYIAYELVRWLDTIRRAGFSIERDVTHEGRERMVAA